MHITVLKKNLRDGLTIVEHATADNNLPVLKSILIRAGGDVIELRATNLEIGITTKISGKIIETGGLAIPFLTFYNIITNLASERIELVQREQTLEITTDNYSAKIQGIPESDFPIIPQVEHRDTEFNIDSSLLRDALLQVVTASQFSEIRPELSGVLFDFQLTQLILVATDSFRLSHKVLIDRQFQTTCSSAWKAIIPLRTIQEIIRIFPATQPLTCIVDEHQILVKHETTQLISRLIDGDYPDYEQVVPKSFTSELSLQNGHFMQALKLVSNFSGKVNDVHLKLGADGKSLEIYSANQYVGENRYIIPVKCTGERFPDVVFNWRYVLDGARVLTSEEIVFSLNGDAKPGLLRASTDTSFFYVVMPIKTT